MKRSDMIVSYLVKFTKIMTTERGAILRLSTLHVTIFSTGEISKATYQVGFRISKASHFQRLVQCLLKESSFPWRFENKHLEYRQP